MFVIALASRVQFNTCYMKFLACIFKLEAREKRACDSKREKTADEKLRAEIERLRREGSKQVEEELERIQEEIRAQKKHRSENDSLIIE